MIGGANKIVAMPAPTAGMAAQAGAAVASPTPTPPAAPAETIRFDPKILARARVCERLAALVDDGMPFAAAAAKLPDRGSLPSTSTLRRWVAAWRQGGAKSLADNRRGRQRKTYGWEARAVELYRAPTRPAAATVAHWLRGEGWPAATESRVRYYLAGLPAAIGGAESPARAGKHHHRQNRTPYVRRDPQAVDAGLIWQGDGHTCDVYVRHPASGKHFRPELTVWLDIRSHFCAGWWLAEAESAADTLYGLSRAMREHDHVPAALHVDPGSGFVNRLIGDESIGWLSRLGIDTITALPGNAKGKGLVEGFFRWFEERVGKRFSSFCGDCRTDDDLRRIEKSLRSGRVSLPSLHNFADAVDEYIDGYNAAPQRRLGCAPADIWAGRERNPVLIPEAALLRPSVSRVSRRGGVEMFGRVYRCGDLLTIADGRPVRVEYDLADDSRVWIDFGRGRLVEAALSERKPWATESRLGDLRAKRESGRLKRLERRAAEIRAQAKPVIDAAADAAALELAGDIAPAKPRQIEGKDHDSNPDSYDYLDPLE